MPGRSHWEQERRKRLARFTRILSEAFIRVETISCDDFLHCFGEQGAKEAGRLRLEGRDYVVQDGDIMKFRFNV